MWKNAKLKYKRMCGVDGDQLPSYLEEFMWKQRHPNPAHHLENIMTAIAQMHPTPWTDSSLRQNWKSSQYFLCMIQRVCFS